MVSRFFFKKQYLYGLMDFFSYFYYLLTLEKIFLQLFISFLNNLHKIMKLFLSSLLFSFLAFSSSAQNYVDWDPALYEIGKIYPGYIVKLDGDTIQGFLKAHARCAVNGIGSSNQTLASFYANATDKKPLTEYKPGDIKAYKIADKLYESINYSGGLFKKANFNVVQMDGAIRVYEWYATVENYSSIRQQSNESWKDFDSRRFETKLIIATSPSNPIEHSSLGLSFSKKMPELISDNAEMAQKVKNKDKGYGFLNMFKVIDEYNEWKRSQAK